MKITRTSEDCSRFKLAKQAANKGCDKCPCCGETKSTLEYLLKGISDKGIISGVVRTWSEGFFRLRNMKCDHYHCLSCGAMWESDPYQWG